MKTRVKSIVLGSVAVIIGINTQSFIARRNQEPKDAAPKILRVLQDGKELIFMLSPCKIGVELQDWVSEPFY